MDTKKRLLIVEDDDSLRQVYEILFSKTYEVVTANDGIEGLLKFTSQPFDIIISDIVMPKLNGVEMAKIIRSSSQIPIIFVTGFSEYKPHKLMSEGLASAVLGKPFVVEEIKKSLIEILK